GQTAEAWRAELEEAFGMAGGHLSLYQLTIEDGTPFAVLYAAGKLRVPDGEHARALYELTNEITAANGLPAYEISNHAVPGEESQHNLLYWRYGEYAGIGPGAHGRLIIGRERWATMNERVPERWLSQVEETGEGWIEAEPLGPREQADEMLLMGLRIDEGLDLDRLERIGGAQVDPALISQLVGQGLLATSANGRRIKATMAGRMVLNEVVLQLSAGINP